MSDDKTPTELNRVTAEKGREEAEDLREEADHERGSAEEHAHPRHQRPTCPYPVRHRPPFHRSGFYPPRPLDHRAGVACWAREFRPTFGPQQSLQRSKGSQALIRMPDRPGLGHPLETAGNESCGRLRLRHPDGAVGELLTSEFRAAATATPERPTRPPEPRAPLARCPLDFLVRSERDHPNLALAKSAGVSTRSGLRALNASAYWTPTRLPTYRSSALYLSTSVA
jgi:hypothetical protein